MDTKALLKLLVETESPSHDKAAVDRVGALVAGALVVLGATGAGAFLSCQASHNKSSEKEKTMKRISRWLSMRRGAFSWKRIPERFRLPEHLAILPWPAGQHV